MPRFLADERCDYSVVRALKGLGLDVQAVAELSPRADDETVIDVALRDKRILLAEDKDFGQLVFANGLPSAGGRRRSAAFRGWCPIENRRCSV